MKKTKINWLNHLLEFSVVLIGILIAFQLNRCSENSRQEELVEQHLENIIEETLSNKSRLQATVENSEKLQSTLDSLMTFIKEDGDLSKINILSLKMMNLNTTYLERMAYESFRETGDLRFITDFDLKQDLVSLYGYYKYIDGMDEMTRESYVRFFYPYAVDNLDLMSASIQKEESYKNHRFQNILSVYNYTLAARMRVHKETLDKMDGFLKKYDKK